MSKETARAYLKKFDLDKNIVEFDDSTATVEDAARALGCTPGEICKTMAFLTADGMVPSEDLEELVGHPMGGVCAFGIKDNVKVYLDESLKAYEVVYPAAGEPNNAVKLTIPELEKVTNHHEYINISKN